MDVINWSLFLLPYEQAVEELKLKFSCLHNDFRALGTHSPIEQVEGRVKRVSAIIAKAKRKDVEYDEISEKIEDIAGIRIICRFVEDIDKVVKLVRARDGIDLYITDERDYVAKTKPSGYRSYHIHVVYPMVMADGPVSVAAEIQIRTMAMDFWATIEHSLNYKYSGHLPAGLKKRLQNAAEASFNLDKEMGHIRGEIIESNNVIRRRHDLVDQIVRKIAMLHYTIRFDKANELNRRFLEIHEEGDIERLAEFNSQLEMMATLYDAVPE